MDRDEIVGVTKEVIFFAMMKAGDELENESFELVEDFFEGRIGIEIKIGIQVVGDEEFEESLCREAIGVVAIGQEAVGGAPPMQAADLVIGE